MKNIVTISIFSRRSMKKPDDFIDRLKLHSLMLSEFTPTKWGWWEPLRKKWNEKDFSKFIPNDRNGAADWVFWTRESTPNMSGSFSVAWKSGVDFALNTHSKEEIEYNLNQVDERYFIEYMQQSVIQFDGDIAYIHTVAEEEVASRKLERAYSSAGLNNSTLFTDTHNLRHWLPELPWGTIFGSAYVKMFGIDCLLKAPAYYVEKLSEDAVYIQLSPKLRDMVENYESVNKVREEVKEHLGRDAFFDISEAYPLRGPLMPCPASEYALFKHPAPIGTVFRVPDFQLIDDEYMQRA
jgi:hypothetical protein